MRRSVILGLIGILVSVYPALCDDGPAAAKKLKPVTLRTAAFNYLTDMRSIVALGIDESVLTRAPATAAKWSCFYKTYYKASPDLMTSKHWMAVFAPDGTYLGSRELSEGPVEFNLPGVEFITNPFTGEAVAIQIKESEDGSKLEFSALNFSAENLNRLLATGEGFIKFKEIPMPDPAEAGGKVSAFSAGASGLPSSSGAPPADGGEYLAACWVNFWEQGQAYDGPISAVLFSVALDADGRPTGKTVYAKLPGKGKNNRVRVRDAAEAGGKAMGAVEIVQYGTTQGYAYARPLEADLYSFSFPGSGQAAPAAKLKPLLLASDKVNPRSVPVDDTFGAAKVVDIGDETYVFYQHFNTRPYTDGELDISDVKYYRQKLDAKGKPSGAPEEVPAPAWQHTIAPDASKRISRYDERLSRPAPIGGDRYLCLMVRSLVRQANSAPAVSASPAGQLRDTDLEASVLLLDVAARTLAKVGEIAIVAEEGDYLWNPLSVVDGDNVVFSYLQWIKADYDNAARLVFGKVSDFAH